MTFTVTGLTRCAGLGHYSLSIDVLGGPSGTIRTTKDEIALDPMADLDATREAILTRCRSAAKESAAATWLQLQTALIGKTFQI